MGSLRNRLLIILTTPVSVSKIPSHPQHKHPSMGWLQRNARFIWLLQRIIDSAIAVTVLWSLAFSFQAQFSALYVVLTAITVLILWPIFETAGIYRSYRSEHPAANYPRIWFAWTAVFVLLLLIGYATQTSALFPRRLMISWLVVTPVAVSLHHLAIRLLLRQVRATGLNTRKAVIAGTERLSQHLAQQIQDSPQLGLQFCGYFTEQPLKALDQVATKPLIGTLEDLPDYVRRHQIDVVYIALKLQENEAVNQLIKALRDTTACVYFAPNITAFSLMQARVQNFEGIPLVSVQEIPAASLQVAAKRLTDIFVAAIGLMLASPLLAIVATALKFSSADSILVRQRCYDFEGKPIVVYRFRINREEQSTSSRQTKLGALIQRMGLESLPQLINVLQGRLSIVGPRPQLIARPEYLRQAGRHYRFGQGAKPGLTGLAQLHGLSGENITPEMLQQQITYDLNYLQSWSFWLDLKIMIQGGLNLIRPTQNRFIG